MDREHNYYATFISVAADCPVTAAEEPPVREPPTTARLHLRLARDDAGAHTQARILFRTHLNAKGLSPREHPEGGPTWEAFFAKGQACLRSSPLAKRYGWGFHFDEDGRVRAVPLGSQEYTRLASDPDLRQLAALRSSGR